MNKIKKIVIVGGGTAGWMAAGYFAKHYGGSNITLIESDKIATIGVGESVTPHVVTFFEKMGVPEKIWMKKTGAVFKYGNKFVGWKYGCNETEYFSFNYTVSANNLYKDISPAISDDDFLNNATEERSTDYVYKLFADQKIKKFDQYFNPQFHYMEKNVAPFAGNTFLLNGPHSYAQHINAELAGHFIRDEIAIPAGVNHIIGKVTKVNHTDKIISSLTVDDNLEITGDFFVDCSGFSKVLVRAMKWEEKRYENNLIDSAWVCQTDYQDNYEKEMVNHTQSIAEPFGWRFKIGLYHRMGNGYCFSSKHISNEEALDYFITKLGPKRTEPRLIRWVPSRLEKFGEGNLAAVGLSCGFVEPLEANALYTIITSIKSLDSILRSDSLDFTAYNEKMKYTIDDIADFLLVHYTLSSRTDTTFWKDMISIGEKLDHKTLIWEKYQDQKNSMRAAITGNIMFPDYMWAELGASWDIPPPKDFVLNKTSQELAELFFKNSEKKHDIISSKMQNSYHWLKDHVFDGLTPLEWEKNMLG